MYEVGNFPGGKGGINIMKKFITAICAVLILMGITVSADEWKDSFATRLMKLMSQNPSYKTIVLTDIDHNNIPEAFLVKPAPESKIGAGITMRNNSIVSLTTPSNVPGACLEDITVYKIGSEYEYVGKAAVDNSIRYYKFSLSGDTLLCQSVLKSDYASYSAIAYADNFSRDLQTDGYPDRGKINKFLNVYETPAQFVVSPSNAQISVDGNYVNVSGFNIDGSNYYKIRDIALILRGTDSKFEVTWNDFLQKIEIKTGTRYTALGTELEHVKYYNSITPVQGNLSVNGVDVYFDAYNIDGNTYFKVRDIGDMVGYSTGWDAQNSIILIVTD